MQLVRTLAWVALRLLVIFTTTAAFAYGGVVVGETLLPQSRSSSDWGFGRLGTELWIGGAVGLILGLPLAMRLGRGSLDGSTRALQTLAALAVPALLLLGQCMEG